MNKSVVVYGPQGTGKTRHAQALAKHFGVSKIVDEYSGGPLKPRELTDTLFLALDRPSWADDLSRQVIPIADALQQAGITDNAAVRA